ncbi:MAG TPA: NAD(P) transhydrogenase subunit alpha [Acidimicrobiales bacterium]|nr:NAD(P) transhydrogenase subunit alpha [Acidimicrobiales bacterium]
MNPSLLSDISIFVLSLLVGFEVISKVPATLHTPLMSAANSIHGIVFVGAMLAAATANDAVGYVLAFITAAFASANLVGGYAVTDRMLQMFRSRPTVAAPAVPAAAPPGPGTDGIRTPGPVAHPPVPDGPAGGAGEAGRP